MKDYLFFVVCGGQKHYFYDVEKATKFYENNGGKMYAYTKDLKPAQFLLYWQPEKF